MNCFLISDYFCSWNSFKCPSNQIKIELLTPIPFKFAIHSMSNQITLYLYSIHANIVYLIVYTPNSFIKNKLLGHWCVSTRTCCVSPKEEVFFLTHLLCYFIHSTVFLENLSKNLNGHTENIHILTKDFLCGVKVVWRSLMLHGGIYFI